MQQACRGQEGGVEERRRLGRSGAVSLQAFGKRIDRAYSAKAFSGEEPLGSNPQGEQGNEPQTTHSVVLFVRAKLILQSGERAKAIGDLMTLEPLGLQLASIFIDRLCYPFNEYS